MNSIGEMRAEQERNRKLLEQVDRQAMIIESQFFNEQHQGLRQTTTKLRRDHEKQVQELFCSCNGLKCDGICREMHLNRPRFLNPKPKKGASVNIQWAEKCPEAYEKPGNYRT